MGEHATVEDEMLALAMGIDRKAASPFQKHVLASLLDWRDRLLSRRAPPALSKEVREALEVAYNHLPSPLDIKDRNDARAAAQRIAILRSFLSVSREGLK